jgi:predicted small secreted protein
MKRILTILALIIAISITITSCTASKGGCKSTQGMVGYR